MMRTSRKVSFWPFTPGLLLGILLSCLLVACGTTGGTGSAPTDNPSPTVASTPGATATASTPGETNQTPGATATNPVVAQPTVPLTAIRMIDLQQGWALTRTAILRTSDGGVTWHDITPAGAVLNTQTKGDFINTQAAWIATPNLNNANSVTILRTLNGGQSWTTSVIPVPDPTGLDVPHFLNLQEGWIEIITNGGPGAGNESVDIWHSTDGGLNWQRIASTDLPASGLSREGFKSGISFRDALNGWATTSSISGVPQNPGLYVTHDGGKSWRPQSIPLPKGVASVDQIGTTPPVFFGNEAVLPVLVTLPTVQRELVLYVSHDGGESWTPTNPALQDSNTVYVIDPHHTWTSAVQTGAFLYTIDGGQTWTDTKSDPGPIREMSFPDPANGWAITDTSLLHRSDNGLWKTINYHIY